MPPQQEIVEQTVKIDGLNINYVKVGNGPQVLFFLPGTLGTWDTDFGDVLRTWDRKKYTMVCWDTPGYGKSRPYFRDITAELNEEDAVMAQKFMKELKLDRYVAIGWSEGGRAAYNLAAFYPDSVQKVVTWGTVVDVDQQTHESFSKTGDFSIWPKEQVDLLTKIYGGRKYYEELWSRFVDYSYDAIGTSLCRHNLHKIKAPVLIMYGSFDRVNGEKAAYFEKIAKELKDGRYILVQGGNHGFHKQPQFKKYFQDTVEKFIAE